jgi:hypothetical protein
MDPCPNLGLVAAACIAAACFVSLGCGGAEVATTVSDGGDAAPSLEASSHDAASPLQDASFLEDAFSLEDACSGGPVSGGVADAACACQFAWLQSTGVTHCGCADAACVCACPEPSGWQGASTAGPCSSPPDQACAGEWSECIETLDGGTGSTGCVCLRNPEIDQLTWECGPTNGWFSLGP